VYFVTLAVARGIVKGAGYATMTAEQMILKYGLK